MASFKLSKKDALTDTRTNIYDLHEKKLEYFESEKNKLYEYTIELDKCILEKNSSDDLERKVFLLDKITTLKAKIENITDDYELNNYLLDFFSVIDQFKNSNNLFESLTQRGVMDTFVNSKVNNSKSEIYNEYIKNFNPELKNINLNKYDKNICYKCGLSDTLTFDTKTSTDNCTNCGLSVSTIYNNEVSPVYTDNLEQVVVFNYKRNNHFQECLNQLQAKENTTIPSKIIKDLTIEFKKYNISDKSMLTNSLIKNYLKKLKYSKYYEHIPTIINEFCGLPAPKLTPDLEQQLKVMFDEIQNPFEKYSKIICPLRKNFLNYNYVFYKMCELLKKDEFLNYFPLLKCREKLYEHDLIWKGICTDLRWEFIATI